MNAVKLAGLQPEAVFAYFEKICSIPHGSGNTKQISDYLVSFAQEHGIRYIQDELNNIILFGEGTCGYEDHEPVILQGHMDMVCEKDPDCPINMDTDGLDVTHDGTYVFANGTSLGGDDGVMVALALALLADPTIAHPPLEVIITVDEETGLEGATGIDLSMLKGKKMINIDSEEEGVFTVSCAGGCRSTIRMNVQRKLFMGPCVKLTVEGLRGGHSGIQIKCPYANANKVMGELLSRVQALMPLALTSLSGGAKDNAIPRFASAGMVLLGMNIERINEVCAALEQEIREQYDEPDVKIYGDDMDAMGGLALTLEDSKKVIELLNAVPNGIMAWSKDIDDLVQTSLNLGVVALSNENISLTFAVRSSVNREKEVLLEGLRAIAERFGADYSERGVYPAWEYRKDSVLRDTMVRVYQNLYGKDPSVIAIHAGLECGILAEKITDLDCISIGPNAIDIHTNREKLDIASVKRTWEFLLEVLKAF